MRPWRWTKSFLKAGGLGTASQDLSLILILLFRASLVAQMVKNPPALQETWVRSLGWEDSLKEGMATRSRILAWRIP